MRPVLVLLFMLAGTTVGFAGNIRASDDGLIVPGERIGPARLDMPAAEIDMLNASALCPVTGTSDGDTLAVRLVTEWGGGCRVSDTIQVGVGFLPALEAFGRPNEIVRDAIYSDATAYWVSYQGWGIAFRVLVFRNSSTLIQAIAVFPGTAVMRSRATLPISSWETDTRAVRAPHPH